MTKKRLPQDYSPEEFDDVVAMIRSDAGLREDIEAITGQTLDGKSPRELFNLFRTIQRTTEVQAAVVNYGRARRALKQTRAELAQPVEVPDATAEYVAELQARLDEEKRRSAELKAALRVAQAPRNVLQLPAADVSRPDVARKAVGE